MDTPVIEQAEDIDTDDETGFTDVNPQPDFLYKRGAA